MLKKYKISEDELDEIIKRAMEKIEGGGRVLNEICNLIVGILILVIIAWLGRMYNTVSESFNF